jgi:hypothetical protein
MTTDSQQSPPSPSASFYDMSDDEEGEYNTIRHSSSGKGVKLLFTKSKVRCLHPDLAYGLQMVRGLMPANGRYDSLLD